LGGGTGTSTCLGVQGVELFAWLESDGFAGGNADFRSGSWVAADACLARTDAENTEAAQFNAISRGQGLFEAFKNGVHGGFRFGAGQPGALNDVMNDILLDQSVYPIGYKAIAGYGNRQSNTE
jgi:hypothetical protein